MLVNTGRSLIDLQIKYIDTRYCINLYMSANVFLTGFESGAVRRYY